MKRVAATVAIGFGCAAIVAAQTSSSSEQTSRSTTPNGTITVAGCLQRGDASGATGTSGTATTGSTASRTGSETGAGASFILTNANPSTGASAATSGTSSTAGTTGTATTGTSPSARTSMGSTYVLEGSSSELSASNVGKRVEVVGSLASAPSSSAAGTTGGTTSSTSGTPSGSSMSAAQHLRISSVRVIGSDCGTAR